MYLFCRDIIAQILWICFSRILCSMDGMEKDAKVDGSGLIESCSSTTVDYGREFLLINVNTVEYAIPNNLQYVDYLGGGNYGNVIKVRTKDGQDLAVKKMYEPFSHEIKARRVYRELKLLQLINHENIIRFVDMYTPELDLRSFKNVYIVSNYAGISLKQVMDRQKQFRTRLLNHDHVKYIIYQLLRALRYLHSANVIHRDLKPSNLAITEDCTLTVLDFGLARTVSTNTDNLTAYVISRWYRSPEVIYWNNVSYNAKADVWSVGCILAELLTEKLIIRLCGRPDVELLNKIERQNSPAMRMVIERMSGFCERKDFHEFFAFTKCQPEAIDLLDRLLVLDPDRRISVEEALRHPYMADYYLAEEDEMPIGQPPFDIEDNENSSTAKTIADWREAVWHELQQHEGRRKLAPEGSPIQIATADDSTLILCSSTNQLETVLPASLTPMMSAESSNANAQQKANDQNGETIREGMSNETMQAMPDEAKPDLSHSSAIASASSVIQSSTSFQDLNIVNSSDAPSSHQSSNPKPTQQSQCSSI